MSAKLVQKLDRVVIRFAGDSGDGMQITGSQFTNTVALYGNDIATFPDFPAEIRAPAEPSVPGRLRRRGRRQTPSAARPRARGRARRACPRDGNLRNCALRAT